jgi:lactoylglutathione lyase
MKKTILLIIITLVLSIPVQAQKSNTFTFNHVALSVKNVDQSAQFYKDILGLQEITNRTKKDGIRWFSFGENKELHLISVIKEIVTINKAVHFALSTSHFDEFIETLQRENINYSDWPGEDNKITIRADGIKQVYIQDPDGYWIEVNSVDN